MNFLRIMMACVCNLATIGHECGRNAPGLRTKFYLACVDDVASIGAATGHVVSTITMVSTKKFYEINIERKDNDLKSTPQDDGGFNTEFKGFITKQSAAKSNILTSLSSSENYILVSVDQNGQQDILGSLEHPIKAKAEPTKTPKNGYNFTAMWEGHSDIPLTTTQDMTDLV